MRGINDDEAPALLRFALEYGYQLRFIEQMPLDAQHRWDRHTMVTAEEILAALAPFGLLPDPVSRGTAPAETWLVPGHVDAAGGAGPGRRHRQCDQAVLRRLRPHPADRGRPDAQLPVRHRGERPAEAAARRARPTTEIAEAWRMAMRGKRAGHGIDDPTFLQPARPMSAIGG